MVAITFIVSDEREIGGGGLYTYMYINIYIYVWMYTLYGQR